MAAGGPFQSRDDVTWPWKGAAGSAKNSRFMKHILVVDDAEAIAYLFSKYFQRHKFRVSVAADGHAALRISEADPIDGVVTDFRMAGIDGRELVKRLRQRQPDLPAIIVSAFATDVPDEDSSTKIFNKPVDPMLLVHRMSDMLIDVETTRSMRSDSMS
ncbi:response regulator [Noviherbaspirillum sp. CPCC 100848]|uniref:Response regulator n=1 Tax=Noviherbaspirillum album TaxID=3080276 RepID=A0ABU6J8S5_9BURK|nr:response regulator [Noviherbaspirillum sp. CPCC 100848]MEC4720053.1 response regulator [Noviherbaspirillum sp. CPCC 100848]